MSSSDPPGASREQIWRKFLERYLIEIVACDSPAVLQTVCVGDFAQDDFFDDFSGEIVGAEGRTSWKFMESHGKS